jgi:pimeloyl-ACP methyl ester carboxylesterase
MQSDERNPGILRRRGYLGIDLDGVSRPRGARVEHIHVGGPADRAGLRRDDVILRVQGRTVSEAADVAKALRGTSHGDVRVTFERDGQEREASIVVEPMPVESIEGGSVVLGEVRARGHLLRTIITLPDAPGPFPAIVCLQGIDATSCEHAFAQEHPMLALISRFSGAGILTMRVERSGVGDSEGPPPSDYGLEMEIAIANAALEAGLSHPRVDPERVMVFGPSLGGMIAPLCPSISRARGVVVFGTSARRWRACAVGTTERQLALRGYEGEELLESIALWAEMHAAVCRDGLTPAEAMAERPHLSVLASRQCRGATLFGRSSAFFRELDRAEVRAAFRALERDVLILHGEYDWVCDAEDGASVVDACRGNARLLELPRIGHDLRAHASLGESYRSPAKGAIDNAVADATVRWIHSELS